LISPNVSHELTAPGAAGVPRPVAGRYAVHGMFDQNEDCAVRFILVEHHRFGNYALPAPTQRVLGRVS
jgi:hypothetical protein